MITLWSNKKVIALLPSWHVLTYMASFISMYSKPSKPLTILISTDCTKIIIIKDKFWKECATERIMLCYTTLYTENNQSESFCEWAKLCSYHKKIALILLRHESKQCNLSRDILNWVTLSRNSFRLLRTRSKPVYWTLKTGFRIKEKSM